MNEKDLQAHNQNIQYLHERARQTISRRAMTRRWRGLLAGWLLVSSCTPHRIPPPLPPPACPTLVWDDPDDQVTAEAVDHFTLVLDTTDPILIPLTAHQPGTPTYTAPLPALTISAHTVAVRACAGPTLCSDPAVLTFLQATVCR